MLTSKRKKHGKAVARRYNNKIAGECLKIPMVREYIIKKIGKLVCVELYQLYSDKTASILGKHSAEVFKIFGWDVITDELLTNAPILMSILMESTKTKKPRVNTKTVIAMCVGLLLKHYYIESYYKHLSFSFRFLNVYKSSTFVYVIELL